MTLTKNSDSGLVRRNGYARGLSALALIVVAFALLTSGALVAPSALSKGAAASTNLAASASPQAPTPRDLTFYMHNNTLAKDVSGVSTPYIFDTLQKFGKNNTITNIFEAKQDWYLFPALAGNLTVNGTISMHIYTSVSGTSPSQNPTLTVSEIAANGTTMWSDSHTFGNLPAWNTPHDLVLNLTGVYHTFLAGSTILVVVDDLVATSRTVTLWYNASWVPSHLIIQSDSFAQVDSMAFLNYQGTPRVNFDPLAANKTITIRVNVTDPLGGYDIAWVNLTLVQPGGASVLTMVAMEQTAGTPLSYVSTYELEFNYSGHPDGRYNATASVLDNSGMYYFSEFYATGPLLAQFASFFYVGGLPLYVNVKAVDSKGNALVGAAITLLSGNVAEVTQSADANGASNFTMAIGLYDLRVVWQGIDVADQALNATANVSAANPVVITCEVYYPVFHAEDAQGVALADATLLFIHPNGEEIGPYRTDSSGNVELSQVPVGTYGVSASWRGIDVFSGSEAVSSNAVITFETAVYELTVVAKAGNGQVLPGAYVSVIDSSGLVFDSNITGADGSVVLRLPAGNYTIEARYITVDQGSLYDSGPRYQAIDVTSSTTATMTFSDFPMPLTSTLDFLFALVYGITVAVLLAVLFLLWRRGRAGKQIAPPTEPEKKA